MKKLFGIILTTAITTFAIVDAICGFISSDGIHYFLEQPNQLLLVVVVSIIGGLVVFGLSTLSPRLQRGFKLGLLGLGAILTMLAGGYVSFLVASLPAKIDPTIPWHIPWFLVLGTAGITVLLWYEFFQVLKSHDRGLTHTGGNNC